MFNRRRIFSSGFHVLPVIFLLANGLAERESDAGVILRRREIGYFWHVSDVFFDPIYSPLGAPENDCHVKNTANVTRNCGPFGELGKCSGFRLVETIARAMNSTRWKTAEPEFCIFTGNLRCPYFENGTNGIYETMSAFITDIQNAGFVDVYPSYGWYDYHPYGHHPLKLTALYDRLENLLREQKTNSSILRQLDKKTGYFSRVQSPKNKIRIIVMNTNFYLKNHIASRLPDPAGQWKWLENELKECLTANQKAFIVMSVPPGVHQESYELSAKSRGDDLVWRDRHNRRYVDIIDDFKDAISAQFAGHRHEDNFRLVYNRKGEAVSVILLAPPINPSLGNYPAMRIYMYDKNSGELLDFVQYYFNLTKANLEADMKRPEKYWEVSYSFRDFHLLPDATISSFEKLMKNFRKNDGLFQRHYRNARGSGRRKYTCEGPCKLVSYCAMTTIDSGSFFECVSGEITMRERHIRHSQPPPEALRNRLIQRNTTRSVSASGVTALSPSPRDIIVDIFYPVILFLLIFFK